MTPPTTDDATHLSHYIFACQQPNQCPDASFQLMVSFFLNLIVVSWYIDTSTLETPPTTTPNIADNATHLPHHTFTCQVPTADVTATAYPFTPYLTSINLCHINSPNNTSGCVVWVFGKFSLFFFLTLASLVPPSPPSTPHTYLFHPHPCSTSHLVILFVIVIEYQYELY